MGLLVFINLFGMFFIIVGVVKVIKLIMLHMEKVPYVEYDLSKEEAYAYAKFIDNLVYESRKTERIWEVIKRGLGSERLRDGTYAYGVSKVGISAPDMMPAGEKFVYFGRRYNIEVLMFDLYNKVVLFLPDKVLVGKKGKIGSKYNVEAFRYEDLSVDDVEFRNYLEGTRTVCGDNHAIDKSWIHKRIDGGPDRRYHQTPLYVYSFGGLILRGPRGVIMDIIFSKSDHMGVAFKMNKEINDYIKHREDIKYIKYGDYGRYDNNGMYNRYGKKRPA